MITRVQDYYITMTMYKHYKEIISRGQNLIIATKASIEYITQNNKNNKKKGKTNLLCHV